MSKELAKTDAKKVTPADAMLLRIMESISQREARLENLLPQGASVARFKESIRLAVVTNPDLADSAKCDPASVVLAVMEAARMGLDVHGHYGHLVKYGKECTFVPDYRGLIALARVAGAVDDMTPILVHERDQYEPVEGDTPAVHHKPYVLRKAGETRGEIIAVYTRVTLPSGRKVIKGLLDMAEIARIESGVPKGGPWGTKHRGQMIAKSSIRNAFKTLGVPTDEQADRFRMALEAADRSDAIEGQYVVHPQPEAAASGVAGAKASLQARNSAPVTLEPEPQKEWVPNATEQAEILAKEAAGE